MNLKCIQSTHWFLLLVFLALGACAKDLTVGGEAVGVSGPVELRLMSYSPKQVVQSITIKSNGSFRFPGSLEKGATFSVSANANPVDQSCSVDNPNSGGLKETVWNIRVKCAPRSFDINR